MTLSSIFFSLSRQNDDLRAKVASFDGLKEMHEKERTELKLTIKKLVSWFHSLHGGSSQFSGQCAMQERGRWTGRRSYPMEQNPAAQAGTREVVGNKKVVFGESVHLLVRDLASRHSSQDFHKNHLVFRLACEAISTLASHL